MSNKTLNLTDALYQYVLDIGVHEHPQLQKLREETAQHPLARMQIAPEQGQFMALLAKLLNVRCYLEVGTFTGYSALSMALAMPRDGRIIACDIDKTYTDIAREHWQAAAVADKIELRLAPANETLQQLLDSGERNRIDMMFIDADKANYDGYYELGLSLLRPGGLMLLDNVLWGGSVIDQQKQDADTRALRAINSKVANDQRVESVLLPLADGLSMIRKR